MEPNTMFAKAAIAILSSAFIVLGDSTWAEEIRVKSWPDGVPCSALRHKSDGSWALADAVIGPDGTRHYPNPDRESRDNRYFGQKCK